jgi:hypothetical protein
MIRESSNASFRVRELLDDLGEKMDGLPPASREAVEGMLRSPTALPYVIHLLEKMSENVDHIIRQNG